MIKDFIETAFKAVMAQFKIPRKGVSFMLLLVLTIALYYDIFILHHPVDFTGSFYQQILYALWLYSFLAIPIKAYNEFCDKKDIEAEKLKQLEEKEKKKQEIFEILDTSSLAETKLLKRFYNLRCTTIKINYKDTDELETLRAKGISFILAKKSRKNTGYNACINSYGKKLLNEYFSKK